MKPVAILYQAAPAPAVNGIRKPMKAGGASDSGADIAYALQQSGIPIITPVETPQETEDMDWVFPDSREGIQQAINRGAQVIWANTVLFEGHPLEAFQGQNIQIVGQSPQLVQKYDDKWVTNELLQQKGLPVAPHMLVSMPDLAHLSEKALQTHGISLPAIIKPIRGRGSQGVAQVATLQELKAKVHSYLEDTQTIDGKTYSKYGNSYIIEAYMQGVEMTATIMPSGVYQIEGESRIFESHWSLPLVERFDHTQGIVPYSGVIAVSKNSRALPVNTLTAQQKIVMQQCAKAGAIIGSKAPIRIDFRASEQGDYMIFDLNMKPNMTGTGRQGRAEQNSLTTMAAAELGWSYQTLLKNMLAQAWEL